MTYIDFDFDWSIIVYHGNLRYSNSYVVMQYKDQSIHSLTLKMFELAISLGVQRKWPSYIGTF
jgi:hypothetical protein